MYLSLSISRFGVAGLLTWPVKIALSGAWCNTYHSVEVKWYLYLVIGQSLSQSYVETFANVLGPHIPPYQSSIQLTRQSDLISTQSFQL